MKEKCCVIKRIFIAGLLLGLLPISARAEWVLLGNTVNVNSTGACNNTYMAMCNETPYIVWDEYDNIASKINIFARYFNGAEWVQAGNTLNVVGSVARNPSIAVCGATPYVAWDENLGIYFQIYVKHYNGAEWVQDGNSLNMNQSQDASQPSLAFGAATPYVAWCESNGVNNQVFVKHYNGTEWVQEGNSLNMNQSLNASQPDLALYNNTPYVAWIETEGFSDKLYVKHFNGTDWENLGSVLNESNDTDARAPTIVFDDATPWVAWYESGETFAAHFNGSGWQYHNGRINSTYANYCKSDNNFIFINHTPYIAITDWYNSSYLDIYSYNGTDWDRVGRGLDVQQEYDVRDATMAFIGNTPYVAWGEHPDYNNSDTNIYVKYWVPPTFTATATPSATATPTGTVTISPTITLTSTITPTATPFSVAAGKVIVYPCPAKDKEVWFCYALDTQEQVQIEIFNLAGEKCAEVLDQQGPGICLRTQCDISKLAPGVYLYRMRSKTADKEQDWGLRKFVVIR